MFGLCQSKQQDWCIENTTQFFNFFFPIHSGNGCRDLSPDKKVTYEKGIKESKLDTNNDK
jgi:hypothetical protein